MYNDINGDGRKDLLVSNHEKDNSKTSIYMYNVPKDLFTGSFTRTQIANGFHNANSFFIPNMSPGFSYPLYPHISQRGF